MKNYGQCQEIERKQVGPILGIKTGLTEEKTC